MLGAPYWTAQSEEGGGSTHQDGHPENRGQCLLSQQRALYDLAVPTGTRMCAQQTRKCSEATRHIATHRREQVRVAAHNTYGHQTQS